MKNSVMILAGVLLCTSCETYSGSNVEGAGTDISVAPLSGEACPYNENGAHLFWLEHPSLEAGEMVGLSPYFSTHPGHFEPLPAACIGEMTALPEGAVEFSRDETGTVNATITSEAEPGQSVMITTDYGGHDSITGLVKVYDADANPLVGRWSQKGDGICESASVIRELVFQGDGSFSVTWMPFESYKDYWGEYAYDADTGILTLTPERGNYIPDDVSPGPIALEGDLFVLQDGMSFGATRDGKICSAPFERR